MEGGKNLKKRTDRTQYADLIFILMYFLSDGYYMPVNFPAVGRVRRGGLGTAKKRHKIKKIN
jgi:hypothetical protein